MDAPGRILHARGATRLADHTALHGGQRVSFQRTHDRITGIQTGKFTRGTRQQTPLIARDHTAQPLTPMSHGAVRWSDVGRAERGSRQACWNGPTVCHWRSAAAVKSVAKKLARAAGGPQLPCVLSQPHPGCSLGCFVAAAEHWSDARGHGNTAST